MSEQIHAAADLTNTDKSSRVALPTRLERVCQAFSVATVSLQVLFIHPRESAVSLSLYLPLLAWCRVSFSQPLCLSCTLSMLISVMLTTFPVFAELNTYHINHIISYNIKSYQTALFGLWFCVYISISFLLRTFKFKSKLEILINLNNCFI